LKNGIYGSSHVRQQKPTLMKQLTGPIGPFPVFNFDRPGLSCTPKNNSYVGMNSEHE